LIPASDISRPTRGAETNIVFVKRQDATSIGTPRGMIPRPVADLPPAIEAALCRLRGIRLRLSLARLAMPASEMDVARFGDDPSLIAGIDGAGNLVVLYVGPRSAGPQGDAASAALIARTLRKIVDPARRHYGPDDAVLTVVHRWSDDIDPAVALILSPPVLLDALLPEAA
jgi:hypothetical protein